MDPKLYRAAMGGKEKMGGEENEENNDDVLNLMQCINDQQQLELQFVKESSHDQEASSPDQAAPAPHQHLQQL
ncbi:unnamed protein product [Camellia sinensis]